MSWRAASPRPGAGAAIINCSAPQEAAQEREHQQQRLRHRHGPSLGR